jgi:hypothetical protein
MAKAKAKPAARKFLVVGVVPGPIHFKKKNFDLSQLSQQDAEYLIANGCPYLKWEDQEQKENESFED